MFRSALLIVCLTFSAISFADEGGIGHSKHGSAFDSGLRSKPWKMSGIGNAPFLITTNKPEVQTWYNQGNSLLHSFWFEEAERSFRWCHKLSPDNAMVYFGLARCGLNWFSMGAGKSPDLKRYHEFLQEAVKLKYTVTERERLYIEAWEAGWSVQGEEGGNLIRQKLQELCIKYPDDIEAKCQLSFYNIGVGSALANEFLIQQVLAKNPNHPGAHHARIHNWDGINGNQAIDSCESYGRVAPGIGHSLHMPGHIYSKIGMWHEAAIAMDSATRVELKYMNDRLALPYETWNYGHNRSYLSYIQEQLGRAEASIQGAKDMANSPRDPDAAMSGYSSFSPMLRAFLKFERYAEILDGKSLPGIQAPPEFKDKKAAEVIALVGLNRISEAKNALKDLKQISYGTLAAAITAEPSREEALKKEADDRNPPLVRTAEAKLLLAEGNSAEAIQLLEKISRDEDDLRSKGWMANDPPDAPWPVRRILGDAYFEAREYPKAISAYEAGLKGELNDAWCLAGLAKSYAAMGQAERAKIYVARFKAVWDGADPGLRLTKEIDSLKIEAQPKAETIRPERVYNPKALDKFGPSNWAPFPAPALECLGMDGKPVSLNNYRGKNVLLVFYLSDQCAHCMEQLASINKKIADFEKQDTVVLAVSAAAPNQNQMSEPLAPFKVTLLSDQNHSSARRFASYDDFENIELHSTILIDKMGKVRWKKTGGDPFDKVSFLLSEIKRW